MYPAALMRWFAYLVNLRRKAKTPRDFAEPATLDIETEIAPVEERGNRPRAFAVGQTVGDQFVIKRFLGEGGMGEVYAAFDFLLGEIIALKTLPSNDAEQTLLVNRLKREVLLARKLRHPNVCAVHALHQVCLNSELKGWAISMEFLDGEPLSSCIRKGLWALPEVLSILRQIASGVQAIHDLEILHRDLKPGNVMILPGEDSGRRAVITDFGLAHHIASTSSTAVTLGRKAIVGTTPYMAPEQLRGEGASKLTDVYSLGVMTFEMVTGRLPFEGETALAIALRRLKQEAPSPRDFRPALPADWDIAIRACLSSRPSDRPPSAAVFLSLLEGEESTLSYWVRLYQRRAFLTAVAGAIAGGGYELWVGTVPPIRSHEAVASYKRGLVFADRRDPAGLQNAVQEFQHAVKLDPKYAEAWAGLANAYCAAAHYVFIDPRTARVKGEEAAKKALALNHSLSEAQAALAYVESLDLKRWRSAEALFRKAVETGATNALGHAWYAAFLGRAGRFEEAIAEAQAGVDMEPGIYAVQNQLAYEYFRGRRFREFYEKARDLVRMHPNESGSHQTLARALQWIGNLPEALKECDIAIAYGDSPEPRAVRGWIQAIAGQREQARKTAAWLLSYWRAKPFEANIVVALLARLEDYDTALDVLDHAYDVGDGTVLACATNPDLDGLRPIPRYRAYLRKLGFDPDEIERTTPRAQV